MTPKDIVNQLRDIANNLASANDRRFLSLHVENIPGKITRLLAERRFAMSAFRGAEQ